MSKSKKQSKRQIQHPSNFRISAAKTFFRIEDTGMAPIIDGRKDRPDGGRVRPVHYPDGITPVFTFEND
jgi:hypothetical protein